MVFLNYIGNVFIPYPDNLSSGVSQITADFIAISYSVVIDIGFLILN